MVYEITTFLAAVGAITGVISLGWRLLDERNRLKIIINKFGFAEEENEVSFNIDFDVSNTSKRPNSIRDVQLHILKYKGIRLGPDKYEDVPLPGCEDDEPVTVISGVYKPIFDIPIGSTVNKKYTFTLNRRLKATGEDIQLILTDAYGKTIKKILKARHI